MYPMSQIAIIRARLGPPKRHFQKKGSKKCTSKIALQMATTFKISYFWVELSPIANCTIDMYENQIWHWFDP